MTTKFKVLAAALGLAFTAAVSNAQLFVQNALTSSTGTTLSFAPVFASYNYGANSFTGTTAFFSQNLVSGDVPVATFSAAAAASASFNTTLVYNYTTTLTGVGLAGSPVSFSYSVSIDLAQVGNSLTASYSLTGTTAGSFFYNGTGSNPDYNYSYTVTLANANTSDTYTGSGDNVGFFNSVFIEIDPPIFQAVPEPSTYALFGAAALAGLVAVRRFRKNKAA